MMLNKGILIAALMLLTGCETASIADKAPVNEDSDAK